MERRLAVLGQKAHRLALAACGLPHQLQRLLCRYGQLHENRHLVLHLAAGLRLPAQLSCLLHAPQQQRRIVAKDLPQRVRLHGALQQQAAHRRLSFRQGLRYHAVRKTPQLPIAVPHRRRQNGVQRIVKRTEIPLPHPKRQPDLLFRHHRLLIQQGAYRLQRLVRHAAVQRQDHRLTESVAAPERHQHTAARLRRHGGGQQVVVCSVDGVRSRLHGDLGDQSHVRCCLPR